MAKVLLVALLITGVAVAGTYGYTEWKARDLTAKAAGWRYITEKDGYVVYACKRPVYGNIVRVQVGVTKSKKMYRAPVDVVGWDVSRRNSTGRMMSASWWGDVITVPSVNTPTDGWWSVRVPYNYNYLYTGPVSTAFTPYC